MLESDPSNIKALFRRAQAHMGKGDYVEAEQDVKAGLLVEPSNGDLLALQVRGRGRGGGWVLQGAQVRESRAAGAACSALWPAITAPASAADPLRHCACPLNCRPCRPSAEAAARAAEGAVQEGGGPVLAHVCKARGQGQRGSQRGSQRAADGGGGVSRQGG